MSQTLKDFFPSDSVAKWRTSTANTEHSRLATAAQVYIMQNPGATSQMVENELINLGGSIAEVGGGVVPPPARVGQRDDPGQSDAAPRVGEYAMAVMRVTAERIAAQAAATPALPPADQAAPAEFEDNAT